MWSSLASATFGAYLIHPIFILFSYRHILPLTTPPSDVTLATLIVVNIVAAFAFGSLVHMCVEAPVSRYLKPKTTMTATKKKVV
jgi:peptidoglycan/LPS O-acetylase OafA/YrhL